MPVLAVLRIGIFARPPDFRSTVHVRLRGFGHCDQHLSERPATIQISTPIAWNVSKPQSSFDRGQTGPSHFCLFAYQAKDAACREWDWCGSSAISELIVDRR